MGGTAGQIAKLLGAGRVIGSAGSAAKVEHLTGRLGFDAAFDYHDGPVGELLRQAPPDGIDGYFDNVGGDHRASAIDVSRDHGRIAWCGAISQYNHAEPAAAPRNLYEVVYQSLRLEGFLVRNHMDARTELEELLVPHIRSGRVLAEQTVVQGFDRVVEAFLGVLDGATTGKMIVQLTEAR